MNGTSSARRRLVRELVSAQTIGSQAELRRLLAASGHDVTQATVSRDLDAVGAVKVRTDSGGRYELSRRGDRHHEMTALGQAVDEFVEAIAVSGNLIVIKVPPGAADLVASKLDAAAVPGALGSVAGDDTLLVVADEGIGAPAVVAAIEGARA